MPILPIDYQKCIIYKLCCNNLNVTDVYVGHTICFKERKAHHKKSCNNENSKRYNLKVYYFIREHGGFENWSMIEIEKHPCNDSREAAARERYWFENLKATLNTKVPGRGKTEYDQEYRLNNAETIKEYQRGYRVNNAAEIKESYKQNAAKLKEKTICFCGGRYSHANEANHFKTQIHIAYCSKIN